MNQKGFSPLFIILSIILTLIIAGSAYYFGKSKPKNPVTGSLTPQPTQNQEDLERERLSRDNRRIADFSNIQAAFKYGNITLFCKEINNSQPWCYGTSIKDGKESDGSGWVKADLKEQNIFIVPSLPLDPINDQLHHYTYCADKIGWEINTVLETTQYLEKMKDDGGDNPGRYEVGSNLQLIDTDSQCSY